MSHIDSNKYLQSSKKKGTYRTLTAYILAHHTTWNSSNEKGGRGGRLLTLGNIWRDKNRRNYLETGDGSDVSLTQLTDLLSCFSFS